MTAIRLVFVSTLNRRDGSFVAYPSSHHPPSLGFAPSSPHTALKPKKKQKGKKKERRKTPPGAREAERRAAGQGGLGHQTSWIGTPPRRAPGRTLLMECRLGGSECVRLRDWALVPTDGMLRRSASTQLRQGRRPRLSGAGWLNLPSPHGRSRAAVARRLLPSLQRSLNAKRRDKTTLSTF